VREREALFYHRYADNKKFYHRYADNKKLNYNEGVFCRQKIEWQERAVGDEIEKEARERESSLLSSICR